MLTKATSAAAPSELLQTLNGDSERKFLACKLLVLDIDKDRVLFNLLRRSKASKNICWNNLVVVLKL